MKRIIHILLALTALIPGLWGCQQKQPEAPQKIVDLRYRADDSYELDAKTPRMITIVIASTDPWTITSAHPEWCMIDYEEGEGSDAEKVHVGQGNKTSVHIQYYDNDNLDDREDILEIRSDYWLGKKIKVHQKGTAFLTVEKADIAATKAAASYTVNVLSNQKWTARFISGHTITVDEVEQPWITIVDGESGEGNGPIQVAVQDNPEEQRKATLAIYDRNGQEMVQAAFTQEGVLLEVEMLQIRVGYNQAETTLKVDSNASWTVELSETDTWIAVDQASHTGPATLKFTFEPNTAEALRYADIRIATVAAHEGDYVAKRDIEIKQGYKVKPIVTSFDQAEYDSWKEEGVNHGVYVAGSGMQFSNGVKIQRSLPYGDYSFYWSNMAGDGVQDGRLKILFAFSEEQEVKYYLNIRADGTGKTGIGFNKGKTEGNIAPEELIHSTHILKASGASDFRNTPANGTAKTKRKAVTAEVHINA